MKCFNRIFYIACFCILFSQILVSALINPSSLDISRSFKCPDPLSSRLFSDILRYLPPFARVHEHYRNCLKTEIEGIGAHRSLVYTIRCSGFFDHSNSSISPQNQVVYILQPLPSDVYADPYELEQFGHKNGFQASLFGKLDLEQPSSECQPTALLLTLSSPPMMTNAVRLPDSSTSAPPRRTFSIPIHAKYPAPASGRLFQKDKAKDTCEYEEEKENDLEKRSFFGLFGLLQRVRVPPGSLMILIEDLIDESGSGSNDLKSKHRDEGAAPSSAASIERRHLHVFGTPRGLGEKERQREEDEEEEKKDQESGLGKGMIRKDDLEPLDNWMELEVPMGDLDHRRMVEWVTIGFVLTCALAIGVASF